MLVTNSSSIPIVDFRDFREGDPSTQLEVSSSIYQACREIGFVYLRNVGISQDLIDQIFTQSLELFRLPSAVKTALAHTHPITHDLRGGYIEVEQEATDPQRPGDLKEAFDIFKPECYLEAAFEPQTIEDLASERPFESEAFCHMASTAFSALSQAVSCILRSFAIGLQMPPYFFEERHRHNMNLRLLHYPPVAHRPQPDQMRAGEHSDFGSITLLFQDDVGGLEVRTARGTWVAAPPVPGAVLVNVGDLMQRWTNDQLRSTKHRVVVPQDSRAHRSRYSVAFFCDPDRDVTIDCLESCRRGEHLPKYPPIIAEDYLLSRLREVVKPLSEHRREVSER